MADVDTLAANCESIVNVAVVTFGRGSVIFFQTVTAKFL